MKYDLLTQLEANIEDKEMRIYLYEVLKDIINNPKQLIIKKDQDKTIIRGYNPEKDITFESCFNNNDKENYINVNYAHNTMYITKSFCELYGYELDGDYVRRIEIDNNNIVLRRLFYCEKSSGFFDDCYYTESSVDFYSAFGVVPNFEDREIIDVPKKDFHKLIISMINEVKSDKMRKEDIIEEVKKRMEGKTIENVLKYDLLTELNHRIESKEMREYLYELIKDQVNEPIMIYLCTYGPRVEVSVKNSKVFGEYIVNKDEKGDYYHIGSFDDNNFLHIKNGFCEIGNRTENGYFAKRVTNDTWGPTIKYSYYDNESVEREFEELSYVNTDGFRGDGLLPEFEETVNMEATRKDYPNIVKSMINDYKNHINLEEEINSRRNVRKLN